MSQGLGIYKYTSTACGRSQLLQSVCLQIQGPGFYSRLGQVKYFCSTTLIYCLLLSFYMFEQDDSVLQSNLSKFSLHLPLQIGSVFSTKQ